MHRSSEEFHSPSRHRGGPFYGYGRQFAGGPAIETQGRGWRGRRGGGFGLRPFGPGFGPGSEAPTGESPDGGGRRHGGKRGGFGPRTFRPGFGPGNEAHSGEFAGGDRQRGGWRGRRGGGFGRQPFAPGFAATPDAGDASGQRRRGRHKHHGRGPRAAFSAGREQLARVTVTVEGWAKRQGRRGRSGRRPNDAFEPGTTAAPRRRQSPGW